MVQTKKVFAGTQVIKEISAKQFQSWDISACEVGLDVPSKEFRG